VEAEVTHRVVLVDDQEEIRTGLSDLIRSRPGFEVVGTAATASEALELLSGVETDLVVADLILGDGPDGIQLTKGIKARDPFVPVLVLSGRHESLFAERALLAGASGYLMKDQAMDMDVLFEAMETVTNHGVWLSKDMEERLLPRTLLAHVDPTVVRDELGLQLME